MSNISQSTPFQATITPQMPSHTSFPPELASSRKPNYNITLPHAATPVLSPPTFDTILAPSQTPFQPTTFTLVPPPGMASILAPSQPSQLSWGNAKKPPAKDGWSDFDPLA